MPSLHAWAYATQQQHWGLLLDSQQHTAVVVHQPLQQPAVVIVQNALQVVPFNAQATALVGFTHTYLQPSFNSQTAGCVVPFGSGLIVTGMTMDRQWYRLDTNTWIPSSWVQ